MKPKASWILYFLTLFGIFNSCNSILNGQETSKDISQIPEFGCRWFGGSTATLSCSCLPENEEEFFIPENSIPSFDTTAISITKCKKVRFGSKAISSMRNLRQIKLTKIESLQLDDSSLQWDGYLRPNEYNPHWDNIPSLKIQIEDTNIDQISSNAFKGQVNSIVIKNVKIENIAYFAFSSLEQMQNLEFENVNIKNIQPQAFKKFGTENLKLDGVTVDLLPSRSFSDISVINSFLINNCTFDVVKSGAFLIYNPRVFEVRNTKINTLSGEGFKVTTRGNVIFRNNHFNVTNDGAFRGITFDKSEVVDEKSITFDTNVFESLTMDTFDISDFTVKFSNIILNENCKYTQYDGLLKHSEYHDEIKCIDNNGEYVTVKDYQKYNRTIMTSHGTVIIVVGVVLILIIIIASILVFYFKKIRNSDRYGGKNDNNKNGKLNLIVPDGRTYRETELHVIVERAELLTTDL